MKKAIIIAAASLVLLSSPCYSETLEEKVFKTFNSATALMNKHDYSHAHEAYVVVLSAMKENPSRFDDESVVIAVQHFDMSFLKSLESDIIKDIDDQKALVGYVSAIENFQSSRNYLTSPFIDRVKSRKDFSEVELESEFALDTYRSLAGILAHGPDKNLTKHSIVYHSLTDALKYGLHKRHNLVDVYPIFDLLKHYPEHDKDWEENYAALVAAISDLHARRLIQQETAKETVNSVADRFIYFSYVASKTLEFLCTPDCEDEIDVAQSRMQYTLLLANYLREHETLLPMADFVSDQG